MAAIVLLTLQRDDGTVIRLPPPPADTGGLPFALVDIDGTLYWSLVTSGILGGFGNAFGNSFGQD